MKKFVTASILFFIAALMYYIPATMDIRYKVMTKKVNHLREERDVLLRSIRKLGGHVLYLRDEVDIMQECLK